MHKMYEKMFNSTCSTFVFKLTPLHLCLRWECAKRMEKMLVSGTTLVVDRYSDSGIAFSAAKVRSKLPPTSIDYPKSIVM